MDWKDVGITVNVPRGAVPKEKLLDLTMHPCLSGPFQMPEGYKPASPVYLITTTLEFSREVKIAIDHFARLQSQDDCDGMAILSASCTPDYSSSGRPLYTFTEIKGVKGTFKLGEQVGVVTLQHFCGLTVGRKEVSSAEG